MPGSRALFMYITTAGNVDLTIATGPGSKYRENVLARVHCCLLDEPPLLVETRNIYRVNSTGRGLSFFPSFQLLQARCKEWEELMADICASDDTPALCRSAPPPRERTIIVFRRMPTFTVAGRGSKRSTPQIRPGTSRSTYPAHRHSIKEASRPHAIRTRSRRRMSLITNYTLDLELCIISTKYKYRISNRGDLSARV